MTKHEDNITKVKFSAKDKLDDSFLHVPLDPSWHSVVVEGREIPNFLARKTEDGAEVMLDNRFVYEFKSITEARMATSMAAEAMAIGAGYPWLGAEKKERPFAPVVIGIGGDNDET